MQAQVVRGLLERYKPDILIITGHDAMLKKGISYSNIYNYRNSKNFINTVKEARKWARSSSKLVIFAGACQSYYEAIISAGANFASSPKRVMIDFIDPLIVAERIATTENTKYLTIKDIEDKLENIKKEYKDWQEKADEVSHPKDKDVEDKDPINGEVSADKDKETTDEPIDKKDVKDVLPDLETPLENSDDSDDNNEDDSDEDNDDNEDNNVSDEEDDEEDAELNNDIKSYLDKNQ